jgi:hypothetical protein
MKTMIKKSPVWPWAIAVLFLTGCLGGNQPADLTDSLLDPALEERINEYLAEQVAIIGFGGEAYCAHDIMNAAQVKDGELYLWALCQEYYQEGELLKEGSGISLPVDLQIQGKDQKIMVMGHRIPRDGSYYGPDVRSIFPKSTWSQIMPQNKEETSLYNLRAKELIKETRMKAALEYNLDIDD